MKSHYETFPPTPRAMRERFELRPSEIEKRLEPYDYERSVRLEAQEFQLRPRPMILLAEDDAAMCSLLQSQLRRDGYRVLACQDGTELVHRIDAYRSHQIPVGVDLVISDVRMPLISGLELLELVRDAPLAIPVILISAFGDVEMRCEAAKRNAAAFFSKPFDVDLLRAVVRGNLPKRN